MRAAPAVGVDDDLPARQPRVPLRTADDELARRVDEDLGLFVEQLRGNDCPDDVLLHVGGDLRLRNLLGVLGGDDHRIHAHGRSSLVLDGDLRLAVGTQVGQRPVLAHLGEAGGKLVREHDGKGHELLRLAAGIAEHHALVARADRIIAFPARLHLGGGVHAQRDIGRLPVDEGDDAALIIGKIARIVADLADDAARHLLIVDVSAAGDLAR